MAVHSKKAIKLRDVLFLCHPKPRDEKQAELWKRLAANELASPNTWEVALSAGADKRETFTRLIETGELGYLALIRNLRNCVQAGVDEQLVRRAILARANGAERVLPFRYVAAARAAPMFEPELDQAMQTAIAAGPVLPGRTVVLVDVSISMRDKLSAKSDLTRMDAGAALASIVNAERLRVFSFSTKLVEVAPRRGMAGVDTVKNSQPHSGTRLGAAVAGLNRWLMPEDRLIVITDEQTEDVVPTPMAKRAFMINVASAQHGVGYGPWRHVDGFSENILRWIAEVEALPMAETV